MATATDFVPVLRQALDVGLQPHLEQQQGDADLGHQFDSLGRFQPAQQAGSQHTPANNSPITEGVLSLTATSAKMRAVSRMINRFRKKVEVSMFLLTAYR